MSSDEERRIQGEVLIRLGSRPDCRLWRANVGQGWVQVGPRAAPRFRPQTFGVKGQPDLMGVIMLGAPPLAFWLGVEVKTADGRQLPSQRDYQAMITRLGGVYLLVRSADDAERQLDASLDRLRVRIRC